MNVFKLSLAVLLLGLLGACSGPRQAEVQQHDFFIHTGRESLSESIANADVIARVRMASVATSVEQSAPSGAAGETPTLVFTFNVLEYLKGTGGTQVVGLAPWPDHEGSASDALSELTALRDTRWDDREAVVMLRKLDGWASTSQANRYFLGFARYMTGDGYSVTSEHRRVWLPSVSVSGDSGSAARSSSSQSFLLEAAPQPDTPDPNRLLAAQQGFRGSAFAAQAGQVPATIELSAFRSKVSRISNDFAQSDGSAGFNRCVELKYMAERLLNNTNARGHSYRKETSVESGRPAETLWTDPGVGIAPDQYGRVWTEGPDQDYFTMEFTDGQVQGTALNFGVRTATARPLTAGVYSFYALYLGAERMACAQLAENEKTQYPRTVSVEAPDGTVAEALFDPVLLDGVTATSTARAFVSAGSPANTAIGAVKWNSGTLQVDLTPAASFSGHHLDFIAQDGTLAETVKVDDANGAGNTLSWAVADAPWAADDKMMVRLYRKVASTCTVADGAMKPGACYQDPVFTGAPFSFTVAEDIAVGSAVGTVAVSHPEMATTTLAIISGDDNGHFAVSDEGAITTAQQLDSETTPSYTLTVEADAGRWSRATAEVTVTVTPPSLVTVTLSPREEQSFTYTDITIEWSDPDGCDSHYFVGLCRDETVMRNLGFHPAPATTTLSRELRLPWDRIPSYDRSARVTCAPSDGSGWTVVGEVSLQSGLPSAP